MGWGGRGARGQPHLRLSYANRRPSDSVAVGGIRAVLWLAVLLYGAHAGAALYEMLVVTPLWATDSAQSVRDWSAVNKGAIRPMAYKEPAVLALGSVSMVVLWLSIWRTAARGLMVLSGVLGVTLVVMTVLFAFPILERILRDGGAGMTDQEIVQEVQAWQLWCKGRLMVLLVAWAAALLALLRASSTSPGQALFTSTRL